MTAPKSDTYVVTCPDYTKSGFRSREKAEQWVASVEEAHHCPHKHTITKET